MHLIDMHCDTIGRLEQLERKNNGVSPIYESLTNNTGMIDVDGMKKAGTIAQFFAHFIYMDWYNFNWDHGYEAALHMIARTKQEIKNAYEDLIKVCSYNDLNHLLQQDIRSIGAFLTIEEGGILNNDIARLDSLYEEGIRLITLTWNYENCLGYPSSDNTVLMQMGLKPFGFEVLEKINGLSMISDVSHLSDGGFWDVLECSKKPVVASHSNARVLCNVRRNLSDEMIKALGNHNGVAGINFYPNFVKNGGICTVDDIVAHVKHMINIGGEDLPAIGTDFDGYDLGKSDITHVRQMEKFYDALNRAGLSNSQIEKVCYKNALRIIKANC